MLTMRIPESIEDIEAMIKDRVQEDIHLDYKRSEAIAHDKRIEISKDVSAFANSDGGILIYGVEENQETHEPTQIDGGVDHRKFSKEWLEDIIMSRISPMVDGLRIFPLPVGSESSIYVVSIPKSNRGPHQASDKKYYKRFNFKSEPMDDYEITDVRNRRHSIQPLLSFEIFEWRGFVAAFDVTNVGDIVAENVSFDFVPQIPWPKNEPKPGLFENGIRKFAPRQKFRFRYFSFVEILSGRACVPPEFDVRITYFRSDTGSTITDVWPITFSAHEGAIIVRSEMEEHAKDLVEGLKNLTEQAKHLRSTLESFQPMVGGTGVNLSVPALTNLGRVLRDGTPPQRIDFEALRLKDLREILGVDTTMAVAIFNCIGDRRNGDGLKHVPGMTPELMDRIRAAFILEDSGSVSPEAGVSD